MPDLNATWEWEYIDPLTASLCCAIHQQTCFPPCLTLYWTMHFLLHKHNLTWQSCVINFICCELFYISTSMPLCENSFRMKTPVGSAFVIQTLNKHGHQCNTLGAKVPLYMTKNKESSILKVERFSKSILLFYTQSACLSRWFYLSRFEWHLNLWTRSIALRCTVLSIKLL